MNVNDYANLESARLELDIANRIRDGPKRHEGREFVRSILDSFTITGPHGQHICIVFEPLREPLWLLRKRSEEASLPLTVVRALLHLLLEGLNYLHSGCHIIHTGNEFYQASPMSFAELLVDLKLDNILLGFETDEVLETYVREATEYPSPVKTIDENRKVYLSRNDFGRYRGTFGYPKIGDFGQAVFGDLEDRFYQNTGIEHYRSPEVLLGGGWSYGRDIWTLAILVSFMVPRVVDLRAEADSDQMWELLRPDPLFWPFSEDAPGVYRGDLHVAQIIGLLGHPPSSLRKGEQAGQFFDAHGE